MWKNFPFPYIGAQEVKERAQGAEGRMGVKSIIAEGAA